jgi:hypothetical protein
MEKKWTPGPWFIDEDSEPVLRVMAHDPGLEPWHICDVAPLATSSQDKTTNWYANAHLIAAAPELYDALEKAIEYHKKRNLGWHSDELVAYMEAALAKARGETGERGE